MVVRTLLEAYNLITRRSIGEITERKNAQGHPRASLFTSTES
jgi:hypothetical protein